ncbi:MAG: hypothetical protein ACR2GY_08710 [Phycisphaerales bacterium]
MPARRLRNLDWQRSLQQVHERGGSLDMAIASSSQDMATVLDEGINVLWRVRLLDLDDDAIVVERPSALGSAIELETNIEVVVILTIGQNRWMFRTRNLGPIALDSGGGRYGSLPVQALRLAMPTNVERCQRRSSYRVNTSALRLPAADVWPLLDPKTVIIAERANELRFENPETACGPDDLRLPDVGPRFSAELVNLGGGGVGLHVPGNESQSLLRHKLFWVRVALPPHLKAPICATAKVVHTHMQSSQDYYAGMAFDFTFNPGHQKFVVEQIGSYVASVQRMQMLKRSA